jgi:hypothetical protein
VAVAKQRGYAQSSDDEVLDQLFEILGRRKAHLRPGMRFRRHWDKEEVDRPADDLALRVRADVNAILQAAGDPVLPGTSSERF